MTVSISKPFGRIPVFWGEGSQTREREFSSTKKYLFQHLRSLVNLAHTIVVRIASG
jgi:hypothetical protein